MDRLRRRHDAANNLALFSGSAQGVAGNACPRQFPLSSLASYSQRRRLKTT